MSIIRDTWNDIWLQYLIQQCEFLLPLLTYSTENDGVSKADIINQP
jgi:hypothetical protein